MPRFFIPSSAVHGKSFHLTGTEAHHVLHVLRKKVGDSIDLFDGKDLSFSGKIESVGSDEIRGTIVENVASRSIPVHLTLYQALTKGSKWEWMLEKVCEIGVSRVAPVFTRRTLIKLDADQGKAKQSRWNRIVLAASKQCGRSDLMEVAAPLPLASAFNHLDKNDLSLIAWEKESNKTTHAACGGYNGKQVNLFIGPEGGWDASEIEQAQNAGVIPIKLGPTLLRTETAGLIAATLALREFGVY